MKFEIGQRVKVVKDEVIASMIGMLGTIKSKRADGGWYVVLDDLPNYDVPYEEDDLAALRVTTIEGIVEFHAWTPAPWPDASGTDDYVTIGDDNVAHVLEPLHGKRVRVTIEVID